jgi:hypothetical protein
MSEVSVKPAQSAERRSYAAAEAKLVGEAGREVGVLQHVQEVKDAPAALKGW